MWEAGRMGLVFVGKSALLQFSERETDGLGPDAGDNIRSVLQTGTEVYATAGKRVIKYFRGKEVGEFQAPDGSELGTMILLGDDIIVLKEDGSGLLIWNTKTGGMLISFRCERRQLMW
jgi:U3 small nucleolar RNA-associated protein 21